MEEPQKLSHELDEIMLKFGHSPRPPTGRTGRNDEVMRVCANCEKVGRIDKHGSTAGEATMSRCSVAPPRTDKGGAMLSIDGKAYTKNR